MALSGSVQTSAYTGDSGRAWRVVLNWSAKQNTISNTSTISWNIKVSAESGGYVVVSELRAKINGTEVYYRDYSNHTDGYDGTQLASGTITVSHDSNGQKDVAMSIEAGIYNWAINKSGSNTFTLNQIDRAAPSVSCAVSSITSEGFSISASSNVTADKWWYSLDNGSNWTEFSSSAGTSASIKITGRSPNTTYQVRIRARKKSNQVNGTSSVVSVKTLGASVIGSAYSFAADVASPVLKLNLTVYDGNYCHLLTVKRLNTTLFTVKLGRYTAGTAVRSITLNADQRTALLNAMSAYKQLSMNILISTFSNSEYNTKIGGDSQVTCTVTTTESISRPTFPDFSYEDTRPIVVAATGNNQVLVQGYSSLKVVCEAGVAKNGATISGYSATIGDASKSSSARSLSVGAINKYGDLKLTVTCTDSRGYSVSISKTVKVLQYSKPRLSAYKLRRRNEVEGLIQLSFSGSISAIKADGSTNTNGLVEASYRYKKTSDDVWCEAISILEDVTGSGTSFSFSSLELTELDSEASYDFAIRIRDKLYDYTVLDLRMVLPQGTPIVALRKRNSSYNYPRVGINNPHPKFPLDVGGEIAMSGIIVLGFRKALSGEDFNTLKDGGIYFYDGNGASRNEPVASAGFLEVLSSGVNVIQRYTVMAAGHKQYFRAYASDQNAWTAWAEK